MKKTIMITSLLCMLLLASTAQARHNDGYLDRIRIEGRIESIRGQIAYVEDDCGATFRVHLGPAWYWDDHDYYLRSGMWVSIVAWQDPYVDYCYAGEIRGRDFCYDLCDSRGYPRWQNENDCYVDWRPTRSFFNICFVITTRPAWYCESPRYHGRYRDGCDNDRRRWHRDDRDHDRHGGGRWDNDDDNGNTREGRRHVSDGNSPGSNPPAGGSGYNQIEKPRDNGGRNDKPGGQIQVYKPRNDGGSKPNVSKSRDYSSSRSSKPSRSNKVTKPSRTEKSKTTKTWARK